jgi:L-rhamnose isomerase
MALSTVLAIIAIIALWLLLRPKKAKISLAASIERNKLNPKIAISTSNFKRLLAMVGRQDIAIALIKANLEKYPMRSPSWACKKAISDLEKQRRL